MGDQKIKLTKLLGRGKASPLAIGLLICVGSFIFGFNDLLGLNQYGSKKSLDFLSQAFPYDQYYSDNSPSLIFVAIDEESIKKLGQWPWPRQTVAKIIENLHRSNVAAIGIDVLFLEEDRYSPTIMSADLGLSLPQLQSLGIVNGDIKLGAALSKSPSVLAFSLGKQIDSKDLTPQNLRLSIPSHFVVTNNASENLISVSEVIFPQETINKSPGLGFVNGHEEGGLIREAPLIATLGDKILPSLGLEMLRVAQGVNNYIIKPSESGHALSIKVGELVVQTTPEGQLLFHHGRASRFTQISAHRLFQEPHPELEGRLVIFGVNALALGDQHATVLEDAIPGALMHLQVLDQILSDRFITTHPGFDRMIFLLCGLVACLVCYLVIRMPLIYSLLTVGLSFSALLGVSTYAFLRFGFVFNFFTSAVILLFGGLMTYIFQSIHEERLRKKIQTSFSQYVPVDVVKRISKSNQSPKLGGELIEATVLFLDLRGFTNLTESLKPYPELMVQVIGTIMDEVTARLIESGATIDKYIGDAVMAFWNAPERQGDHLLRSIYGACRIQEDLELIRSKIHAMDPVVKESKIAFGIGICCGPITVGNFGSSYRFNYTVLGDAVNTASRLESLTKEKGRSLLIVADGLEDGQVIEFNARKISIELIGNTEIRGKIEVLKIFTASFIES